RRFTAISLCLLLACLVRVRFRSVPLRAFYIYRISLVLNIFSHGFFALSSLCWARLFAVAFSHSLESPSTLVPTARLVFCLDFPRFLSSTPPNLNLCVRLVYDPFQL